jgi:sodium/potassium-transporting ATPase subunit alpha
MAVTDYAVHVTKSVLDSTGEHTAAKLNDTVLRQIQALTGLCNAGEFDTESANAPLSERRIFGDATDQAILRYSESLGSVAELRKSWQTIFTLGFDSKNKFMIKVIKAATPGAPAITLSPAEAEKFDSNDVYVFRSVEVWIYANYV